ncbi:MAG: DUF3017 domain-containing protein [Actinomycetales bacterium]|nr:DUF3017 domain-containing protein [Actinomycetales bacterium]
MYQRAGRGGRATVIHDEVPLGRHEATDGEPSVPRHPGTTSAAPGAHRAPDDWVPGETSPGEGGRSSAARAGGPPQRPFRIHWQVQPRRRMAFVGVLLVMATAVLVTVVADFRAGGYLLAAALGLAALLRAVLPATLCLGLLVRSRRQDVVTALVLGTAVAVLARTLPG